MSCCMVTRGWMTKTEPGKERGIREGERDEGRREGWAEERGMRGGEDEGRREG